MSEKMFFDIVGYAIMVIVKFCDVIRYGLGIIASVTHTDAPATYFQHRVVVGRIAKSPNIFQSKIIQISQLFNGIAF